MKSVPTVVSTRLSSVPARWALVLATLALHACQSEGEEQWLTIQSSSLFLPSEAAEESAATHRDRIARAESSCEERKEEALASLENSSSQEVRALIAQCADARLNFGGELRCLDGRLQVQCLP